MLLEGGTLKFAKLFLRPTLYTISSSEVKFEIIKVELKGPVTLFWGE